MWRISEQIAYSQNSIRSPELVKRLLNKSNILNSELVIEIGAGTGIITIELAKKCRKVIAYEIDIKLFTQLKNNLNGVGNVSCVNTDFLKTQLPAGEYKIFSNIPFNFTSRIINKLLNSKNPPSHAYLVLQKEAAQKLLGVPRETQMALLLKPIFKISRLAKLRRSDFNPKPRVKTVFIEIKKLKVPTLNNKDYLAYRDFIVYATTQWRPTIGKSLQKVFTKNQLKRLEKNLAIDMNLSPLSISFEQWLKLYEYFKNSVIDKKKSLVNESYLKRKKPVKKVYKRHKLAQNRGTIG